MTKVRFEGPIGGFSGAMGKMVFADQKKKGRTIAYMKTQKDPTEARLEQQACFLEAAARADAALKDPATRAFYEKIAQQRDQLTRNVAIGEFLCRPFFKPLGLSSYKGQIGDIIEIRAKDSIGLVEVNVDIRAQDGSVIEQGKAVEDGFRSGFWKYTATAPVALGSDVFIEVVGFNHVGTMAKITENPTVGAEE
jgi:hypothetical protein